MTLEQKVGQLFMVSLYGPDLSDTGKAFLGETLPGGVALFNYNGATPAEFTRTVNAWQKAATTYANGAGVPLLVATDQEGGRVARLQEINGFSALPTGWALGAVRGDAAELVGKIAAEELRAVGIQMNLAPVADVLTIPRNPIMERRALGSLPDRVSQNTIRYAQGLQGAGVVATFKHFPGHGDATDSHTTLPRLDYDRARLDQIDLAPFRAAIQSGTAQVIMVGHLVYPALDPSGLPASLSKRVVTDILRGELGFKGVAMTDALDMDAIDANFGLEEAAIRAINGGIDLLTTGPHLPLSKQRAMVAAVRKAAQDGTIPMARIDAAALRILTLKERNALLDWTPLDVNTANERVNVEAHRETLKTAWAETITMVDDPHKLVPVRSSGVALIYPGQFRTLPRRCRELDPLITTLSYHESPTDADIANATTTARSVNRVIVLTLNAVDQPEQQALVRALPTEKTLVVALQNPYDLGLFPGVGHMASYQPQREVFDALCEVIYGKRTAVGTLPIRLHTS